MEQTIMENDTPNLPQEIIRNILVRLPVKSLIRFQCVCKDWKNLFKTPTFIAEHLHHSPQQNPLLIVNSSISESTHLCLLNREMQVFESQNPHIVDSLMLGWVYSSNGLLCVNVTGGSQDSFWLWNPAIRVVRQVPKSLYESVCFSVGFGFSPISNDYKIVKLISFGDFIVPGEVYSSRAGLWRKLEVGNLVGVCGMSGNTFPCNGAIFWIVSKQGVEGDMESEVDLLMSFDIEREVFTLIPFPTTTTTCAYGRYDRLASYENKLAIFFPTDIENCESHGIDMWVLEECTDPSRERWSWAKIYSSRPNPYRFFIHPVIIWRNEIVCIVHAPDYEEENYEGKVILCNLATDEFNLFDLPKRSCRGAFLDYVESLVLLDDIHI